MTEQSEVVQKGLNVTAGTGVNVVNGYLHGESTIGTKAQMILRGQSSADYDNALYFWDGAEANPGPALVLYKDALDNDKARFRFNDDGDPGTVNLVHVSVPLEPILSTDACSKTYVDTAASSGLKVNAPCRLRETSITQGYTYNAGVGGGTMTAAAATSADIDGIAVVIGDRILMDVASAINDQNQHSGIYEISVATVPIAMTRVAGMPIGPNNIKNSAVLVTEGSTYGDITYVQTANVEIDEATPQVWTEFSTPATYTAGDGLTLTGTEFKVNSSSQFTYSSGTLTLAADAVDTAELKDGSVVADKLANVSVTTDKILNANVTNAKLANSSISVAVSGGVTADGPVSLGGTLSLGLDSTVVTGVIGSSGTTRRMPIFNGTNTELINSEWQVSVDGNTLSGVNAGSSVVSANAITATSDARLKTDLKELESTDLDDLKVYSYVFKTDESKRERIGVLAQDLEKKYPQAVLQDASSGYYTVDYCALTCVLLRKVQELSSEVAALKSN